MIDDVRRGLFRPATGSLIAISTLVSMLVLHAAPEDQQAWFDRYGWVSPFAPAEIHRLFTANFLHADYLHLVGNMVFLFAFGVSLEARLGAARYLLLYFAAGAVGWLAHGQVSHDGIPAIGASAAISGLITAYLVLYPRARFLTLILLLWIVKFVQVRAWFFIALWIGIQLWSAEHDAGSNVAYWAHLGGAALGLVAGAATRLGKQGEALNHEVDSRSNHHGLWSDHQPAHGVPAGVDREGH